MTKQAPDRYAVMGNPVSHSKSPLIHSAFAEQCRQHLEYSAIEVKEGEFQNAVKKFFSGGGKGLNITVPFKQEAWELADVHSQDAALAGAVNTLFMDADGRLNGHNTDGIGLVRDVLENHSGRLAGKSALILGAGGASRGILLPLLREGPASITIANRTVSKAQTMREDFLSYGDVRACGFEDLPGRQFDWVFNATSASLKGDLPPLPETLLAKKAVCYDLMYAAEETVFCAWARQHGAAQSLDGLGMLVEQAAESFYLWRGVRPETIPVIEDLRQSMFSDAK